MRRLAARASLSLCLSLAAGSALARVNARMLRTPDVSRTHVAFSHAGDIWIAPKEGGSAERLSTPPGEEVFPRFSPDGSMIAFSGNYDGNADVYVVSAQGGPVRRLTHHPAGDRVIDWHPDGERVLFVTSMTAGKDRFQEFYLVSKEGGLPERVPVPYAAFGAISPDGKTLAYTAQGREFSTWKRYRGGHHSDLWLFGLKDFGSERLTREGVNDEQPMWSPDGKTLFFLSDRGEGLRVNLWARDVGSGRVRQVTHFTDQDVRFPAIGPSDIVFEHAGRLHLMHLDSEEVREVRIEVVTDRATLRPRAVNLGDQVASASISPSGKRVVFQARGELFSVPAEHGPVLALTRSSGSAERTPAWSPDGKQLAYWSDRTGEYELTVRPADGSGKERTVTQLGPGFRYQPYWSPDSKKIVFVDQSMRIRMLDVASGKVTDLDKGLWMYEGDLRSFEVSWSADSRWVAWARGIESLGNAAFVYDTRDRQLHQVTSGFYRDYQPVFDPGGKYLYLLTGRTFRPTYSDLDNTWVYANTTNIAAIPLRRDVPSPMAPRNDVEGEADEDDADDEEKEDEGKSKSGGKSKGKKKSDDKDDDEKKPAEPVVIHLDAFEERLVLLPPEAGNYTDLQAAEGRLYYRRLVPSGAGEGKTPVVFWDLKEREEKVVLEDADGFELSADGKKVLVLVDKAFHVVDADEEQELKDTQLRTAEMEVVVDPAAEWRQIFDDAWRLQRDYFYDPGMHGVDWQALRARYGALLDDALTRWDVNFIIGELIGELNSSHAYRGGGDLEKARQRNVGLLGVDFELDRGAYRIARILRGAPWDSEVRSPLDRPGVDVREGDWLLAVDGVELDPSQDPWAAFEGLAEKAVVLTVNDRPDMEGARQVLVEPLKSEGRLRHLAWIDGKRRTVEERTNGRVGYVYVPDTGVNGQNELVRQLVGQVGKDGMVIDERFNSGGQIPDRFVELLNRPRTNYWGVRDGRDWPWPMVAVDGPMVMLMNSWSGSGGDAFPYYFKQAGLGPLIGTRTWGGLIGISGVPDLVDGGDVTVPTFSFYSMEGEWAIENHGVDPDIEVLDDPALMVDGGDPQLERAIEEVLRLIEQKPPVRPKKPAYPKR